MTNGLSRTLRAVAAATVFMAGYVTAQPADSGTGQHQQTSEDTLSGPKLNYEFTSEHCSMSGEVSPLYSNESVIECHSRGLIFTATIMFDPGGSTYLLRVTGPSIMMVSSGHSVHSRVSMNNTKADIKISVFPAVDQKCDI